MEAARLLLRYGADVNAQCPPRFDRRRAIDFAVMVDCLELTELLLSAGASLSLAPGSLLTTPLPVTSYCLYERRSDSRFIGIIGLGLCLQNQAK